MSKIFGAGSPTAIGKKKESKRELMDVEPVVTEGELTALLEKDEDYSNTYSLKNEWKPMKRSFIDLSVDQFYDEFVADNAPFSFQKFSEILNHTDIKVKPWKKNQMTINCVVPLVNVPFMNKSNFVKTIFMLKRDQTKMVLEFDQKTLDAPYGDTFSCKESWIILTSSKFQTKCIF